MFSSFETVRRHGSYRRCKPMPLGSAVAPAAPRTPGNPLICRPKACPHGPAATTSANAGQEPALLALGLQPAFRHEKTGGNPPPRCRTPKHQADRSTKSPLPCARVVHCCGAQTSQAPAIEADENNAIRIDRHRFRPPMKFYTKLRCDGLPSGGKLGFSTQVFGERHGALHSFHRGAAGRGI